jgi:hypothetical protein
VIGGPGSPPGPTDEIDSGDVTALDVLPGDDVAVVCGWIDAAPTDAVVLYVMRGNSQLASELGMRRLAHHAAESGRSVAIVTRSWSLAGRARQAGIPVAARIDRVRWDAGGHRVLWFGTTSLKLPRLGRYGPALAIAAVLGVMAWLALSMAPAATVTFAPPQDDFARTLTVSVSSSRTTADIPRLLLPGHTVTVSHTITLARRTTGSATAPTGRARVELTITNGGAEDVSLPAGSVLLAGEDGPLFALDRHALLPARGTLGVTATALMPGPAGNVPPAAIDRWRDAAYSTVTVTNPAAATGGADGPVPAVAAEDIAAITAEAEALASSASLLAQAFHEHSADAVLARTATATVTFDDPAGLLGTEADTLLLRVTYTVTALAIRADAIDALARALLAPPGTRSVFVPGSARAVDTGAVNGRDADGGELVEIELRAAFTRDVLPGDVKDLVKGRSQSGALASIEERYGIADAEVDLAPGWAPWVPRFGFRIDVKFRPPAPPGGDAAEGEPPHGSATANASPRP